MSIIKLEGSSESTFSMKQVRYTSYFVDEFGPLLIDLEKWPPRNKVSIALGLDPG